MKSEIPKEGSAGDKCGQGPEIKNPRTGKASDNTRADVKAQITNEGSAGNKRGEGPAINVPAGGSSENSRAGVKAEIPSKGTSGVECGEGQMVNEQTKMTSAERRAKQAECRAMAKANADAKMSGDFTMANPDMPIKDGKVQ